MKPSLRFLFVLFLCQYVYADSEGNTKQAEIAFWATFNDDVKGYPYRWLLVGNRIIRHDGPRYCQSFGGKIKPCKTPVDLTINPDADVIGFGVFHWHLSADELGEQGIGTKLPRIQNDIIEHLRKRNLKPDVFVFTGTGALNNAHQKELLCQTILEGLAEPNESLSSIENCKLGESPNNSLAGHLIDSRDMFVVSLLPVEVIALDDPDSEGIDCMYEWVGYHVIPFARAHLIKVFFGKHHLKMMVHSSFDEVFWPLSDEVTKKMWGLCWDDLDQFFRSQVSPEEPMIFITHIGNRQVKPQFLAGKIQAVIARKTGVKEFDLSTNSHAQFYSATHSNEPTSSRLSWVMTRIPALGQEAGIKQNPQTFYKFRPDSTPSGLYFPHYDYTAMFPSYTTFIIHRKFLNNATE